MAPLDISNKEELVRKLSSESPLLANLPAYPVWIDYDKEADVLYISFEKPQNATDSELTNQGILLRYRNNELVGITILEASKR